MKIKNFIIGIFALAILSCQPKMKKQEYIFTGFNAKSEKDISSVIETLNAQTKMHKTKSFGNNQFSSKSWKDDKGNFVKEYNFTRKNTKFYEFLPIVSYFLPKHYQNYEIVVVFGDDKKVKNVESFYNNIKLKSSLFCHPPKKSCVAEIY